ncbi:putative pinin/SDK/memA/ domain-containing protein [Neospora caninum Liverpool]|uniref:Putative pinin/SDK/memA/ domain-containing protein n=1 Tax=Neospora caninum (strain Liverpool) TaxID=572307 RepID=F0VD78_NEOCL|nr:putative pinin/SDK/memA/ domain-containing protein [Neospora caninum Liverpool]CBZ51593.1 putative pinin/SDK/memA/ domain-containing protein [Neospora caninum Liverpool]|eukprot:XP_003881626.1 putative pinin/SDK/memA/ domain-containing protein [Neospora caninum Liverpool]
MNESRLRQEIRKLVTEQRQLNRRLQQQRRPPGALFSFDRKEESPATSLPQKGGPPDASPPQTGLSQEPVQAALGNGAEVPGERPTYSFEGEDFQVEKRAHKQKQQEERVAQKLAMSQKNIAKIARLEWEERRQQEQLRLEEVSTELANKENELMRLHLVKHYKNMEVFIGTEAQPTLFWSPAKWDDTTRRLQEQTKLWIRTKVEHIEETDYTYRPQGASAGRDEPERAESKTESETAGAGEERTAAHSAEDASEPQVDKNRVSEDSDEARDKSSEKKS